MTIITEREIAVRGFNNERINTSFGKGLFRRAIYNCSVELRDPNEKYLIDLYDFAHWQHQARSDYQIDIVRKMANEGGEDEDGLLLSWIQHYNPLSKTKTPVEGYCIYLLSSRELYVEINDPANNTFGDWSLRVQQCTTEGTGKPVFIATNVDLGKW
jgi:hypothetical protein